MKKHVRAQVKFPLSTKDLHYSPKTSCGFTPKRGKWAANYRRPKTHQVHRVVHQAPPLPRSVWNKFLHFTDDETEARQLHLDTRPRQHRSLRHRRGGHRFVQLQTSRLFRSVRLSPSFPPTTSLKNARRKRDPFLKLQWGGFYCFFDSFWSRSSSKKAHQAVYSPLSSQTAEPPAC